MEYNSLSLGGTGDVLVITINRPKALNALNDEVIAELNQVFGELADKPQWHSAILTGSGGKAFVAGADIAGINQLPGEKAEEFSHFGQEVFAKIEASKKPVIAAVNGFALGGGCELAMACHMRVASENARFGQPEVNLGLIAGYGGTQRLPRLIGRTKATELLLTGDMIKAPEALALGLVNYVVPQADLMAKCTEILEKIATKSPLAVGLTLEAIQAGVEGYENGYATEAKNFGIAVASDDGREGTGAFLEKRQANFTGK